MCLERQPPARRTGGFFMAKRAASTERTGNQWVFEWDF